MLNQAVGTYQNISCTSIIKNLLSEKHLAARHSTNFRNMTSPELIEKLRKIQQLKRDQMERKNSSKNRGISSQLKILSKSCHGSLSKSYPGRRKRATSLINIPTKSDFNKRGKELRMSCGSCTTISSSLIRSNSSFFQTQADETIDIQKIQQELIFKRYSKTCAHNLN